MERSKTEQIQQIEFQFTMTRLLKDDPNNKPVKLNWIHKKDRRRAINRRPKTVFIYIT